MEWHVRNDSGKDVIISTPIITHEIKIAAGESACIIHAYCDYSLVALTPACKILWEAEAGVNPGPIFFRIKSENIEDAGDNGWITLKEWTLGKPDTEHDFFNERDWTRYDSSVKESSSSEIPLYTWVFTILPEDIVERGK